jgi:cytochrome c-type biogenesis protein CcmH
MIRILLLWLLLSATPALAISDPTEALPDPLLEARAVEFGRTLRCLVCQNESIEDSGADLARDLRKIVRTKLAAGESEPQIKTWLVARYGDFVLLKPPVTTGTLVLWASPVICLLVGGLVLVMMRRSPNAPPAPLTEAERRRLERLTRS